MQYMKQGFIFSLHYVLHVDFDFFEYFNHE